METVRTIREMGCVETRSTRRGGEWRPHVGHAAIPQPWGVHQANPSIYLDACCWQRAGVTEGLGTLVTSKVIMG